MTTLQTVMTQAGSRRGQRSRDATLCLRIGAFAVRAASDLPDALEDMRHLYREAVVEGFEPGETVIDVRAERKGVRRRFTIWGDDQPLFLGRRADEVLPYMEWAINWRVIVRHQQFLQLHAGSLRRGGSGVILSASSGSGKTTLTAGLVARGWRYFSDEFALIDPGTQQLHAFPKALCIKHGSFEVVRSLGLPLWERRHYAKAFKGRVAYLSPADFGENIVASPCPIHFIVLPKYTGAQRPSLTEIPRAEAVMELARNNFNRHALREVSIETLTQITREAQCYRFEVGNLAASCELLESVVD